MYAGCGYAGDFAGDPLLWVDDEMLAWTDADEDTVRAHWTGDAGLPGGETWISYNDGSLVERGAQSPEEFTAATPSTIPNIAAVAVAAGVSDGSYDPLGGENLANISTEKQLFHREYHEIYRQPDDDLKPYVLYKATGGSDPDPDADTPYEEFDAFPHETAALSYPETHRFILTERNTYNLESKNRKVYEVELDASGDLVATPPSAPRDVTLTAIGGGKFKVTAAYFYLEDLEADRADTFLVFLTTGGGDPDPDLDTPTEVSMTLKDGVAVLEWESAGVGDGVTGKVIVRTRRSGSPDVDSTNTAIIGPATSSTTGPAAPVGDIAFGAVMVQTQ